MPDYMKAAFSFFVVVVFVMMASSWSSNLEVEARYLPTRSDPLTIVGPPRGEDPRFDRLYAVVKEVCINRTTKDDFVLPVVIFKNTSNYQLFPAEYNRTFPNK